MIRSSPAGLHVSSFAKGAPAGLGRDIPAGRRCGPLARGNARGPILFQSLHDGERDLANRGERVFVPFLLGPTGLAGSNRRAILIVAAPGSRRVGALKTARHGTSSKIFRGEYPHLGNSIRRVQRYVEGFLECRKSLLEIEKMRRPA